MYANWGAGGVTFGLATKQRDSPGRISQSGSEWLRSDTQCGTGVDVCEYSPQPRFEGNNETVTRPIASDVAEVGPVNPPTFADADAVTPQGLRGLYDVYCRGSQG